MDSPAKAIFEQVGLKNQLVDFICNDCGISTIKQFKYLDLEDLYNDLSKNVIYKLPNNEKLILKDAERKAQKISSSDSVRINFDDNKDQIIEKLNIPPSLLQKIPESIKTVRDLKYYFLVLSENSDGSEEDKGKDKKKEKEDKIEEEPQEAKEETEKEKDEKDEKMIEKLAIKRINDYFGQVVDSSRDGVTLNDSLSRYYSFHFQLLIPFGLTV